MSWIELQISTTNEAIEPITHVLSEAGIHGVEIDEGWVHADEKPTYIDALGQIMPVQHTNPHHPTIIKAYLLRNEEVEEHIEGIKKAVRALKEYGIHLGACTFQTSEVFEEDWATAWQQYYKPVHVTDVLTVTPTWE